MKKEIPGQLSIFDIFGINCFKSNKPESIKSKEDYLLDCVLHGTGFENGRIRVNKILNSNLSVKDQISAIKKECGIGGSYWSCMYRNIPNVLIGYETFGTKGLKLYYQDEDCKEQKLEFSWSEVRKAIITQIKAGLYLKDQTKINAA